jgi:hypothetical protein
MVLLTPPSELPQWASQDQLDPVSLQNNVLVPPPVMKNFGWYRKQFPPRQWFNWLGRLTYQWIAYLSQQASQQVVTDGTGVTPAFDVVHGGLGVLWVVDTAVAGNFYNGMAYIPPSPGSPITLNTINSSTLTVSTVSVSGSVVVSGGTGPYLVVGQTNFS